MLMNTFQFYFIIYANKLMTNDIYINNIIIIYLYYQIKVTENSPVRTSPFSRYDIKI